VGNRERERGATAGAVLDSGGAVVCVLWLERERERERESENTLNKHPFLSCENGERERRWTKKDAFVYVS
jgi:hypothetical protein